MDNLPADNGNGNPKHSRKPHYTQGNLPFKDPPAKAGAVPKLHNLTPQAMMVWRALLFFTNDETHTKVGMRKLLSRVSFTNSRLAVYLSELWDANMLAVKNRGNRNALRVARKADETLADFLQRVHDVWYCTGTCTEACKGTRRDPTSDNSWNDAQAPCVDFDGAQDKAPIGVASGVPDGAPKAKRHCHLKAQESNSTSAAASCAAGEEGERTTRNRLLAMKVAPAAIDTFVHLNKPEQITEFLDYFDRRWGPPPYAGVTNPAGLFVALVKDPAAYHFRRVAGLWVAPAVAPAIDLKEAEKQRQARIVAEMLQRRQEAAAFQPKEHHRHDEPGDTSNCAADQPARPDQEAPAAGGAPGSGGQDTATEG